MSEPTGSSGHTPDDSKVLVDMSGESINQRLDLVSSLRELGQWLRQAQPMSDSSGESRSMNLAPEPRRSLCDQRDDLPM